MGMGTILCLVLVEHGLPPHLLEVTGDASRSSATALPLAAVAPEGVAQVGKGWRVGDFRHHPVHWGTVFRLSALPTAGHP